MVKNEIKKAKKKILKDDDYCVKNKSYSLAIPAVIRTWVSHSISLNNKPQ
ncbi:MAG: hypothetical protein QNJ58_18880 [Desulfobacterales bacterium]|nr:hypothetical protein [Desulfobacterales bacterium]